MTKIIRRLLRIFPFVQFVVYDRRKQTLYEIHIVYWQAHIFLWDVEKGHNDVRWYSRILYLKT